MQMIYCSYGETTKPVVTSNKYDQWKLSAPEYEEQPFCEECKFFIGLKDGYGICLYGESHLDWKVLPNIELACESHEEEGRRIGRL